ncbi:MAG: hypothetical protein AMXMBFR66_07930 [Pseudomonadota bacterium]
MSEGAGARAGGSAHDGAPGDTMRDAAYAIDGAAVDRDAFYAAACDPARSVVVEACAGAGKTWMLVSRIVRALLAGAEPQQILAITFTRRAAGEMRARLDEWLRQWAGGTHAGRVQELRARGLAAAQAEALAPALAALHERVLRSGRGVEVRTFHAWFSQLLAHAPLALLHRLGLPAGHELVEDTAALWAPLLQRVHEAVQADAALRHVYLEMVGAAGRSRWLKWLEAVWQRRTVVARADDSGTLADAVAPAAALWPQCAGLAEPVELMLADAALRADLADCARAVGRGGATAAKAAAGLVDALALAAAGDAHGAHARAWSALMTQTGDKRKHLGADDEVDAAITALGLVGRMQNQHDACNAHRALVQFARLLRREYAALKRARGLVDMDDLDAAAEALLGDGETAVWVQQRLDQRLRHLLVDEFQDTSPLQWRALAGWLAGYAGAGGGASGQRPLGVFIVGDPKQSIYRFRGAEPRLFDAARDFVVQGLDGQLLQCDHTRRNARSVVAALNAVFEPLAAAGVSPFRPHTTESLAAGAVLALPAASAVTRAAGAGAAAADVWRDSLGMPRREPEQVRRAAEAGRVATAVAQLVRHEGFAPRDVMVLARRRIALAAVADALAAAGVPHALAEKLELHRVPEVLDLAALLDVLASPGHDLSLARALKSPLFGADDAALLWLAQAARASDRSWLDALLGAAAPPDAALARAATLLGAWQALVHRLPPHDLLDRIVHEGEVLERMAAAVPPARRAYALQALQALVGAALLHEGGRFATAYGFVRALRAGRVLAHRSAPADAVQLLTVHGAKGLEARAVLLVDSDAAPRRNGELELLVDWPPDAAAPQRVAFLRSAGAVPPSLEDAWASQRARAEAEELNALYVAMTRARERLLVSCTQAARASSGASWWTRIAAVAAPWQPLAADQAPAAEAEPASVPCLARPPARAAAPPPRAATADAQAVLLGRALHRALEWLGDPGPQQRAADRPAACRAALAEQGLPGAQAALLLRWVTAIVDGPHTAHFFRGPGLRWAGSEVTLAHAGRMLRLDRLVELADADGAAVWWVLDFKLEQAPHEVPAYREQLARYRAAVQALQPLARVRAAFVTAEGALIEP